MVDPVIIGNATLYLGDCRKIIKSLEADMMMTSPPYNCGMDYGASSDKISLDEFTKLLSDTLVASQARVKAVNVGQYIGSRANRVLFRNVLNSAFGVDPIDEIIWNKGPANGAAWGNFPNSPRIRAQHESVFIYGNATMPNGNGLDWSAWSRLTTSIWTIPAKVDLSTHPAMMPVELAVRCISLWCDKNGNVLDPFMGSGTTGVAAAKLNKPFIGIEQDARYFDIACKRIEDAQRQGDLFIA